jgi:hypothetical protein
MIRTKTEAALDPWIAEASASLLASFAEGLAKSEAAVRAAITQPWSNGQTEGQVNRLKMIKRQRRLCASPALRWRRCLDGARGSRVIFGTAQVVDAVMSSAFCAENRVRWP